MGRVGVAAAGDVVAVNDDLVSNPSLSNADLYDNGWFIILKPENRDQVKLTFKPGADVTERYEAKLASQGFAGCP